VRHLCTPISNLTYSDGNDDNFLDANSSCSLLNKTNITRIVFWGDSYLRHVSQAMLMTLTDSLLGIDKDFKVRRNHSIPFECLGGNGDGQFSEKGCSQSLAHIAVNSGEASLCQGRVKLEYIPNDYTVEDYTKRYCTSSSTLLLWSAGSHPIHGTGFDGTQHNAPAYQAFFESLQFCSGNGNNSDTSSTDFPKPSPSPGGSVEAPDAVAVAIKQYPPCIMAWMSSHHRMVEVFGRNSHTHIEEYNTEMHSYFDSGKCGSLGKRLIYVDAFNFTKALVNEHEADAMLMTHDKVHWARVVNLLKVQLLLAQLSSSFVRI